MDSLGDGRSFSPHIALGQQVEVPHDNVERDLHVVLEHSLVGAVAHASRAPDEKHRHRRHGGHHPRIVPRAAARADEAFGRRP